VLTNISFLVAITKRQVRKGVPRRDYVADLDLAGLDHGPFGVPDAIQRHIRTVGNIRPLGASEPTNTRIPVRTDSRPGTSVS
jgi:hypothetical protein